MQRQDKAANEAFFNTERIGDRERFGVRPDKLHSVEIIVPWILPHLRAGDRVLDVAGGSGTYASQFVRAAQVTVVGLDIAESMVHQRAQDPLLPFNVVADMEALPLASSSFDAAIFIACLHHVPDPLPALREAWRVLKPGGLLFSSDPSSLKAWRHGSQPIENEPHEFRIWVPRLADEMRTAGFVVEQITGRDLTMRALGRIVRAPSMRLYHAADAVDRILRHVPRLELLSEVGMVRARKPVARG